MSDLESSSRSYVSLYEDLPDALKKQLSKLHPVFVNDDDIVPVAEDLYRRYGKKGRNPQIRKILFRIAMLKVIAPDYLLDPKWFPYVYGYDNRGHIVRLEKTISMGRHVFVLQGRLDDDVPVCIKWYQSNRRDTLFEIGIYKKLRHLECPTPWFSSTYQFWDSPVLVMEKLSPLGKEDNEFEVAAEVIKQLTYLHQFGVHNDIKPGNIMKRIQHGKPVYFMIDHGGVATQRLGYGYRRWIWSPKWTCQRPHASNQVTTPKHDFIELGYTMKTMQNWTTGDTQIRAGFTGKLAEYMDRVSKIDERHVTKKDYQDLIDILLTQN